MSNVLLKSKVLQLALKYNKLLIIPNGGVTYTKLHKTYYYL